MEPPGTGLYLIIGDLDLTPTESKEIKDPQVVHISNPLTSKHDKIRIDELGDMISPFPGGYLIFLGCNFNPLHGTPIQNINGVKTLFIGATSSKDDDLIIFLIVVHGAVGPLRGDVAFGFDFPPFHSDGIEGP